MAAMIVDGRRTTSVAAGLRYRRFRPRLVLGYLQDLRSLIEELTAMAPLEARTVLDTAIEVLDDRQDALRALGLTGMDLAPTIRYGATLRVLRDLVSQGWTIREDDEGIILDAPGRAAVRLDDPEAAKESIRQSFAFAREAQLREEPTRQFIEGMERRGIGRLFANGDELAKRLAAQGPAAVQPVLEIINQGGRDTTTGILLQDVWRYVRHFWSIPYQNTPGRNIFYLVRDTALAGKPLIGIAALGNPVLGLSKRDDYYRWSANGLEKRLGDLNARKRRDLAGHLVRVLREGVDEIYSADLGLPADPLSTQALIVATLQEIERQSAAERLAQLDAAGEQHSAEYLLIRETQRAVRSGDVDSIDWERVAKTALYRRKRAGTLADLYRALGTLMSLGFSERRGGDLQRALDNTNGRRAIETALRRIKQEALASNVMELITCGAVHPYRGILGGKLVALLMLSRRVVRDVEERYGNRVSIIASAMAGHPIRRPARLALITTSSLYAAHGSSQYNRIKVAAPAGPLAYRKIAQTESFGTVQFAPDTVHALNDVARLSDFNRREVNNLFGEGASPKLRMLRTGLEALDLDSDSFLRHNSRRIVYGAALCTNTDDIVLGINTRPRYLLPTGDDGYDTLVTYWRDRWLASRITRTDVLEGLRAVEFESFRLSRETAQLASGPGGGGSGSEHRDGGVGAAADQAMMPPAQEGVDYTFIERLYRNTNIYADRLTPEELGWIHVDLGVDDYAIDQAKKGRQIVVTGNPGDGKTHIIERLRPPLETLGARVITDANACSDDEVLKQWHASQEDGKPFVLAINEWPLYVLQRLAAKRGFGPVAEALRQATSARFFVEEQRPDEAKDNVVVIDLSLRNILSSTVVERVIERLTQDRFFVGLNEADPALANRDALREPRIRKRLAALLELVTTRSGHVTMRQLVGFIAYLITGGQSATDRVVAGQDALAFSYSNLAFEGGEGLLFEAVRDVFDPAEVTHPDWDGRLWLGDTDARDWLGPPPPGPMSLNESERNAAYRAIKRRFFFEHKNGVDLLRLVPADEREFQETLNKGASAAVVRDLVLALNRFFEPDCEEIEKDHVQLWQSHRYDVRAPSTFVSFHALSYQHLRIEPLKMAQWVEAWLPAEQLDRRSFALVASWEGTSIAFLEINRELFLTLVEAERGLGRSSWSRTATRRITRFIDRVHGSVESESPIEDIRIRNVESDLDERFSIQREPARYQL